MTRVPGPMCIVCMHRFEGFSCTAYPGGIPRAIVEGRIDHREPFDDDAGVTFAPHAGVPPSTVRTVLSWYDDTDLEVRMPTALEGDPDGPTDWPPVSDGPPRLTVGALREVMEDLHVDTPVVLIVTPSDRETITKYDSDEIGKAITIHFALLVERVGGPSLALRVAHGEQQ